uniref:DUF4817 domain-containing protein n=1 Tax=Strigamia maritima TaxID=126957 RepID=T1J4F8_STRMM
MQITFQCNLQIYCKTWHHIHLQNEIFVELLLLYFRNGENQSKASQLYAKLHPDQPAPSHKVVERLIKRFLATGSVQEIKHGRPKSATAENDTIDVLASVEVEPKLSVRQRAQASGISKDSVCRILKTNKIHPYKTRFVQELLDRDPVNRLQSADGRRSKLSKILNFTKKLFLRTNQLLLGMDKLVGIGPIIGQKQILTTLHMLILNTLKN